MTPVDYVLIGAAVLAVPAFVVNAIFRARSWHRHHDDRARREFTFAILWLLHALTVAFTVGLVRVLALPLYDDIRVAAVAVMVSALGTIGILQLIEWPFDRGGSR